MVMAEVLAQHGLRQLRHDFSVAREAGEPFFGGDPGERGARRGSERARATDVDALRLQRTQLGQPPLDRCCLIRQVRCRYRRAIP